MTNYGAGQPAIMSALAVITLFLAGCGAATGPTSNPVSPAPATSSTADAAKKEPSPNVAACARFAKENAALASYLGDGKGALTVEDWRIAQKNQVKALDDAALRATGRVAERMEAAVELIPAVPLEMVQPSGWRTGEAYNLALTRITSACEADGAAVNFREVTLPPEIFRK